MSRVENGGFGGDDYHGSYYNPEGYAPAAHVNSNGLLVPSFNWNPCINTTVVLDRSKAALFLNTTGGPLIVGAARTNYAGVHQEGGLYFRLQNGTWGLLAGGEREQLGLPKDWEVTALAQDAQAPEHFFVGTQGGKVFRGTGTEAIGYGAWWKTTLTDIGPGACVGAGFGRGVDSISFWPNVTRLVVNCYNKVFYTGYNYRNDATAVNSGSWTQIDQTYTQFLNTAGQISSTAVSRVAASVDLPSYKSLGEAQQRGSLASHELVLMSEAGLHRCWASMDITGSLQFTLTPMMTANAMSFFLDSTQCTLNATSIHSNKHDCPALVPTDVVGFGNRTYIVSTKYKEGSSTPRKGNGVIIIQFHAGETTFTATKVSGELGNAAVKNLAIDPFHERIFAVTHGAGAWEWSTNLVANGGFEKTAYNATLGFAEATEWSTAHPATESITHNVDSAWGEHAQPLKHGAVLRSGTLLKVFPVPMRITGWMKKVGSHTNDIAVTVMYSRYGKPYRNVYIPISVPTHTGWLYFAYTITPPMDATHMRLELNGTSIEQRDANFVQPPPPATPNPTPAPTNATNATGGRRFEGVQRAHHSGPVTLQDVASRNQNGLRRSPTPTPHVMLDHIWVGKASEDRSHKSAAEMVAEEADPSSNTWPANVGTNLGNFAGGGPNPNGWTDIPGPPSQPTLDPNGLLTISTTTAQANVSWFQA